MAGNTSKIQIMIEVDAGGSIRAIRRVGDESARSGRQGETAFRGMAVSVGQMNQRVNDSLSRLLKIGTAVAGIIAVKAGIERLVAAGGQWVDLSEKQDAVETRLAAVLKSTGEAAGFNAKELSALASEYQRLTTVGDEVTLGGMAILATFKQVRGEAFERATMAALDMAEVMEGDLKGSIVMIGKALNDPIANLSAMTRAGVQFTGSQKEAIKTLWEMGDTAGAQNIILKELESQFGGTAAAARLTFGGMRNAAKNAYGDMQESLGAVITKNQFFIDLLKLAEQQFQNWTVEIDANRDALQGLAKDGVLYVVESIGVLLETMRFFHNAWLGLRVVADTTLVVISTALYEVYRGFRAILSPLDLIYQGMVALGLLDVNPFDNLQMAFWTFQQSTLTGLDDTETRIMEVNARYDRLAGTIRKMRAAIEEIPVAQADAAEAVKNSGKKMEDAIGQVAAAEKALSTTVKDEAGEILSVEESLAAERLRIAEDLAERRLQIEKDLADRRILLEEKTADRIVDLAAAGIGQITGLPVGSAGGYWESTLFPGRRFATRSDLDRAKQELIRAEEQRAEAEREVTREIVRQEEERARAYERARRELEREIETRRRANNSLQSQLTGQAKSITDWLWSLGSGDLAAVQSAGGWGPRYEELLATAKTGENIGDFLTFAKERLNFERLYSGGMDYSAIYNRIAGDVTALSEQYDLLTNLADIGLGTSIAELQEFIATLDTLGVSTQELAAALSATGEDTYGLGTELMNTQTPFQNVIDALGDMGATTQDKLVAVAQMFEQLSAGIGQGAVSIAGGIQSVYNQAQANPVITYEGVVVQVPWKWQGYDFHGNNKGWIAEYPGMPKQFSFGEPSMPYFEWVVYGPGGREGGIFSGPDEGHLELLHGTEAVIPLKSGAVPVEINPEAIGKALAAQLAPLMSVGGDIHVHLHMDGREIGRAVARQAKGRSPELVEAIQQVVRGM